MQLELFEHTSCAVCSKRMRDIDIVRVHYFNNDDEADVETVCGEVCRLEFFIQRIRGAEGT